MIDADTGRSLYLFLEDSILQVRKPQSILLLLQYYYTSTIIYSKL